MPPLKKKFKAKAVFEPTKRKRTIELMAQDDDEVVQMLKQLGFLAPFDITEELPEPPTNRQIDYAKALKFTIPESATKEDVSALIDKHKHDDDDPSAELIDFADGKGLVFSKYIGNKSLYNLLFTNLSQEDKTAFFVFSIYRGLSGDGQGNLDKHVDKEVFYAFARGQIANQSFIKSLNKYNGIDLIAFGILKFTDGSEGYGGSVRTIAYETCADFLQVKFGTPKTKTVTIPKAKGHYQEKSGCMSVTLFLIFIISFAIFLSTGFNKKF